MGFLSDSGVSTTGAPSGGGFISDAGSGGTPDQQAQAQHVNDLEGAAQVAQANAAHASSLPGLAENFGKDLWENSGIPGQFESGLQQYRANAPKWMGGTNTTPNHGNPESALGVGAGVMGMVTAPIAPLIGNTGPKAPIGISQGIKAYSDFATSDKNPFLPAGTKGFNALAASPTGDKIARGSTDISNAAAVLVGALGGVEGAKAYLEGRTPHTAPESTPVEPTPAHAPPAEPLTPNVKGGFLEHAGVAEKPPVRTPQTIAAQHTAYARSMGYEPYTPDDQLPTIKMGPKGQSSLPTIQTEAPTPRATPGGLTYEPIKETPSRTQTPAFTPNIKGGFLENASVAESVRTAQPARILNPTPVYRASSEPFDQTKVSEGGIFVSPSENIAGFFDEGGTRHVEKLTIAPDAKILEWKDVPEQFKNYDGKDTEKVQNDLAEYARARGYDVVAYEPKPGYPNGIEHQVVNPRVLRPEIKPANPSLRPAESLGEARTSTLASRVNADAVARRLTEGLGELPEYNRVNMKEQAQFATDLISNEPEKALRIAMGQEAPPAHILPEAVYTALEDHATKVGDIDTLQNLATKSTLSLEGTAMGQRIRALGERDSLSPVKGFQEVQKARAASVKGGVSKATKDLVDSGRAAIKASAPTKDAWTKFVQDIQCGY